MSLLNIHMDRDTTQRRLQPDLGKTTNSNILILDDSVDNVSSDSGLGPLQENRI